MTNAPDKSLFSVNEKDGEYTARFDVRGSISISISAASKEEAHTKAQEEVDKICDDGYVEINEIEDVRICYVVKDRPMFRVLRNGKVMQVTQLEPGDTPREPNEYGF